MVNTFTIPDTIEGVIERARQLAEDSPRLERIKFETAVAALPHQYPDDPVMRNAKEFGLRLRYQRTCIQQFLDDGMTVKEFAEASGMSVAAVIDALEIEDYREDDDDEDEDEDAS